MKEKALKAAGFWLHQNLLAIDQLFNTLLAGWADETLSARAYRVESKGRLLGRALRPIIDGVFWTVTGGREKRHCEEAFASETLRRHSHPEYRT